MACWSRVCGSKTDLCQRSDIVQSLKNILTNLWHGDLDSSAGPNTSTDSAEPGPAVEVAANEDVLLSVPPESTNTGSTSNLLTESHPSPSGAGASLAKRDEDANALNIVHGITGSPVDQMPTVPLSVAEDCWSTSFVQSLYTT